MADEKIIENQSLKTSGLAGGRNKGNNHRWGSLLQGKGKHIDMQEARISEGIDEIAACKSL